MQTTDLLPGEIWLPLPEAEGRYEVSDLGRVRSLKAGSRAGTVTRKRPLLMTPRDNGAGYLVLKLRLCGGYSCAGVSCMVLRAFVGPKPTPHHQAAHLNGRPHDNRLHNLAWATPKENDGHKDNHGTRPLRPRRRVDGVDQYRCTQCDAWLTLGHFRPLPRARRSRCGVSSWCRSCENARSRERKRRARRPVLVGLLLPPDGLGQADSRNAAHPPDPTPACPVSSGIGGPVSVAVITEPLGSDVDSWRSRPSPGTARP